jgi:hypothetical protein
MKTRLLAMLLAGFSLLAVSLGICGSFREIDVKQVANHIGQKVIVRGRVTQVARDHGEVFICFGGKYPNQPFKGFIEASSPLMKDKTFVLLAEENRDCGQNY